MNRKLILEVDCLALILTNEKTLFLPTFRVEWDSEKNLEPRKKSVLGQAPVEFA